MFWTQLSKKFSHKVCKNLDKPWDVVNDPHQFFCNFILKEEEEETEH